MPTLSPGSDNTIVVTLRIDGVAVPVDPAAVVTARFYDADDAPPLSPSVAADPDHPQADWPAGVIAVDFTARQLDGISGASVALVVTVAEPGHAPQKWRVYFSVASPENRTALFPSRSVALAALRANQLVVSAGSLFPGVELPDDYLWSALVAAEADASRRLRVFFEPVQVFAGEPSDAEITALDGARYHVEPGYDYEPDLWVSDRWGLIAVRERPIIAVQSFRFAYPLPGSSIWEAPADWLRIDRKYGRIQLVPVGQAMTIPGVSAFVAQQVTGGRTIPQMIRLRYTAGLADPVRDFPDLVALVQRMAVLRIVQDAFLPQSGSVSVDGLSQSLSRDADKYQEGAERLLSTLRESIHGIQCMVI